jgi:diguanylate cyclase
MTFLCEQVVSEIDRHDLNCDPRIFHVLHLFLTEPGSTVAREVQRLIASEEGLTAKALLFVYENFVQPNVSSEKQFESMKRSQGHLDAIRSSAETSAELCKDAKRKSTKDDVIKALSDNMAEILARTVKLEQELAASQSEIFTDSLTGIYNRRYLEAEFAARQARPSPKYFLALLDIDHFKNVNDTYGHIIGDQVLKLVATAIKSLIRSQDVLCRYGGEEFAILFDSADETECADVVERVRLGVTKHKLVNRKQGQTIGSVTLSAGLALVEPDDDFDTALERVDRLLYKAKQAGRDRLVIQM